MLPEADLGAMFFYRRIAASMRSSRRLLAQECSSVFYAYGNVDQFPSRVRSPRREHSNADCKQDMSRRVAQAQTNIDASNK